MKFEFLQRRLTTRQTATFFYLLLLIFLALLLTTVSTFAADCINVEPHEGLGGLHLEEATRLTLNSLYFDTKSRWETKGPFRLHLNANGKIDYLQYTPKKNDTCFQIKKINFELETTPKQLKQLFPSCRYSPGLPLDELLCEGFQILIKPGKPAAVFRIDVNHDSPASRDAERAQLLTEQELSRWWPGGSKKR